MSHPGQQRRVARHLTWLDLLLYVGIATCGLLVVCLVAATYLPTFGVRSIVVSGIDLLSFPLPDSRAVTTILVGFVSLLFVREHFSLGFRPFLSYSCFNSTENKRGLVESAQAPTTPSPPTVATATTAATATPALQTKPVVAVTTLENGGGGIAIVREASYRISFVKGVVGTYGQFKDVREALDEQNLVFNKDYWLCYFSPGWSIAKEKEVVIFELALSQADRLFCLDIKLSYEGLLGDRYEKEIFCIPRPKKGEPFAERPGAVLPG